MKGSIPKSIIVLVVFFSVLKSINCRYLPTRSDGNNLNKLRELMIDVLDSSNVAQDPENDVTSNNLNTPLSKLKDIRRPQIIRNIFDSNISAKENSALLAYLNQYSNSDPSRHHSTRSSLNQLGNPKY